MEDPKPTVPHQFSSTQVLIRLAVRILLVSAIATFNSLGFRTTFAPLFVLAALFCALNAALRRETMFSPVLTHWDEAAAFATIGYLASMIF